MTVHANVMIKDEALLLPEVYKQWKDYPIDHWVFYNDNSSDNTEEVIRELFGKDATILNDKREEFSESHNRSRMLEYSRENMAEFVVSIDTDELMSSNLIKNWQDVLKESKKYDLQYFWYNVVDSLKKRRNDPLYQHNYRPFILPMEFTGKFDMSQYKYHTPRTPEVSLPRAQVRDVGFIHLQSINKKFYALKQLWYKHYEYVTWGHSIDFINNRYDPVVNKLDFQEVNTPEPVIENIEFDVTVYDEMEEHKGYKKFIEDNLVPELVTFGREYISK
ncbi:MAG: glycosyltransferase family 2 protein [Proteobacteria bacterium]|nr:glycosyltransferase family 2 protein [Pseudomonadota bacterium]